MGTQNKVEKNIVDFLDISSKIVGNYQAEDFYLEIWNEFIDLQITSPIEQILYTALKTIAKINEIEDYFICNKAPNKKDWYVLGLCIFPQRKIGKYRVDFEVYYKKDKTTPLKKILVECDGHNFHDKTKEQRAYEKQRDRYLQKQGYKVFHYTGSEIVKNTFQVASEILSEVLNYDIEYLLETVEKYNG